MRRVADMPQTGSELSVLNRFVRRPSCPAQSIAWLIGLCVALVVSGFEVVVMIAFGDVRGLCLDVSHCDPAPCSALPVPCGVGAHPAWPFGRTVSYLHARPDGTLIEPLVSIEGVWNFDQAESLTVNGFAAVTDDWRARLEAGLSVTRISGANLRTTANLDGIGSDNFMAYGEKIKLSIPLNCSYI